MSKKVITTQEKIDLLLKAVKKGCREIKRLKKDNYLKVTENDISLNRLYEINQLVKKAGEKI